MIGYNIAALRYISNQVKSNKLADFYEREPGSMLADEATLRDKLAQGLVWRKRTTLK